MTNYKITPVIIIVLSLLLVACSTEDPQADSQTVPEELDKISIQMSWIHEYSIAPFHEAIEHGDFAENGLEATLVEGGFNDEGSIEPIDEVLSGESEFGMASTSSLIEARSQGQEVVAIAALLQRSPLTLLSLEENEIVRPQDLIGKTVSVADGGARQIYDSLLGILDIDPDEINTITRTSFGIEPLLDGEVDVLVAWIINEGVAIEEAGESYNAILMSDYALDSYEFVLFTSEDYLENNRDIVQRTVTALMDATRDVIDAPEEAIEYTLKYNPDLDKDAQLRRLNATIPLMNVPNVPLGFMDAEVWEFSHQILLDNEVIAETVDLDSVYTTEFINTEE